MLKKKELLYFNVLTIDFFTTNINNNIKNII